MNQRIHAIELYFLTKTMHKIEQSSWASIRRFARIAAAMIAVSFAVLAQTGTPDEQKPRIRSFSHAIHAVEDLDTTLAFYREVFGLNGMPSDFPNPAVPLLTTRYISIRHAI